MSEVKIRPEVVAVAQYIELDRANWWRDGIARATLAALWLTDSDLDRESLAGDVRELLGVDIAPDEARDALAWLESQGDIFVSTDDRVRISQEARERFERDLEVVEDVDRRAFEDFSSCLTRAGLLLDPSATWQRFKELVLEPMVLSLGARTYEVVRGGPSTDEETTLRLVADLDQISADDTDALRAAAIEFLDPSNDNTRSYILRRLNASFFIKAAGMPKDALDAIDSERQGTPQLTLLLDTNFLFSLLELHENPSNEQAVALRDLAMGVGDRVKIDLRVLPITIDEARRVLSVQQLQFGSVSLPSNVAKSASRFLSGAAQQYAIAAEASARPLSAKDFFSTYEQNLIAVLRDKGVEVHNSSLDDLRVRQDVLDDVLAQEDAQKRHRQGGAKPYESNLHDMVIYHFADDARGDVVESPLDARYWVVTLDFGLIAFDKHRLKHVGSAFPVCLHPATLMQLLRFWIPRDETFDSALLGAFRLPFLHAPFDAKSEAMTIRILDRLSKYENVESLLPESITSVLENDALRSRIETAETPDEADATIEQALIEELNARERQLAVLRQQQEALVEDARQADTKAAKAVDEAEEMRDEVLHQRERIAELESGLAQSQEASSDLEARVAKSEADKLARDTARQKRRWSAQVGGLLVLAVALWLGILAVASALAGAWTRAITVAGGVIVAYGWYWASGLTAARWPLIEGWRPVRAFQSESGKTRTLAAVLAVITGVIAGFAVAPLT